MFVSLFIRILSIFFMVFLGALARKLRILDVESTRSMSFCVVNFFYPALIFSSIVGNFSVQELAENWALPAGTIMIMSTGYLFGLVFSSVIKFRDEEEKHTFMFQSAINNYSFLPLPIILMLWGEAGVAKLIFSSLGSEISVWTIGVFILTGHRFRIENLKRLLSMPMVAILFAIVFVFLRQWMQSSGWIPAENSITMEIGRSFMSTLGMFGKATIPLAMMIAGSCMAELKCEHLIGMKQLYTLILRLIIIPASVIGLLFLLPFPESIRNILIVVAIMPCALASVVLSEVYNADRDFAASSVLITHLFSLITIPAWLAIFV